METDQQPKKKNESNLITAKKWTSQHFLSTSFLSSENFLIWKLVCTIDKIDKMRHIIRIFLHHHRNLRRLVLVFFFYYSIDRTSKSQLKFG